MYPRMCVHACVHMHACMPVSVCAWMCACMYVCLHTVLHTLAGVPVGWKSSVCLICMKYRIIILIIIIKRPGEILLSYIANTSRIHPVLMYPSQHFIIDEIHLCQRQWLLLECFAYAAALGWLAARLWRKSPPGVKVQNCRSNCCAGLTVGGAGRSLIGRRLAAVVFGFLAFTKYLGRIETRIRNKKYLGWMRSVRAISRGDWARNANCILRTSTDRLKTNYRVDVYTCRARHPCTWMHIFCIHAYMFARAGT